MQRASLPTSALELEPGSALWPAAFDGLRRPVRRFRVLGAQLPWRRPIAIVGTRFADDEALAFARQLSGELAAAGCTIVSGGAHGIDAAAHLGALAAGGCTVAVLAHGFDRVYPRLHADLFSQIVARGGALATEQPDGSELHRASFVQRNRLIAGLAEAVVVVQAPARSGALSTAAIAFSLGIPVFAVPMAPWIVRGEGNLQLLRDGAEICTCSRDVLSVRPSDASVSRPGSRLARSHRPQKKGGKAKHSSSLMDGMDDDSKAVYGQLAARPRHLDELAERLKLPVPRLHRAILELVLTGLARENSDGAYEPTQ